MGGGLMQLVAYGAQDVYLTGNPQITFWKVTLTDATQTFAMESIEQTFQRPSRFRSPCHMYHQHVTVILLTVPIFKSLFLRSTNNSCSGSVYARWLRLPWRATCLLKLRLRLVVNALTVNTVTGCTSGINSPLHPSNRSADTTRWLVTPPNLHTSVILLSTAVDGPCDSTAPRQVCAPRNALPETTLYVPLPILVLP